MKHKKTLYLKFIFIYILFGGLSFATVRFLASDLIRDYLIKDKADSLYKEASLISNKYASYFYNSDVSTEDVVEQLDLLNELTYSTIWIVNSDGQVIYNSQSASTSNPSFTIEGFEPPADNLYYSIGTYDGHLSKEMLSVYAPISYNFRIQGYVLMHYPMDEINNNQNTILYYVYISVAIIFILSGMVLLLFTDAVYAPLKKITKATEEYASGNLQYTFDVNKKGEMGYLCTQLNYMANQLSQTEENQKKFIANVSHDFRSPLTSISGYLTAMSDGTIPPEMHEKYINIVLNETDRLTKLTNSLLTLNNLNTAGMVLEISDFDINKVVKNTVATFEGICKQKLIKMRLVLCGQELFVSADMGKIQQVLYNLIDNAIKFSENKKTIQIETSEKNETVFVSVKDEGLGIPKDSMKHIFDRFYKTDASRGKDKKGTGLGLSIAKEIINAHHENINVISTIGVGSEFIFTLPKAKEEY